MLAQTFWLLEFLEVQVEEEKQPVGIGFRFDWKNTANRMNYLRRAVGPQQGVQHEECGMWSLAVLCSSHVPGR